jgi:hypothetical protein
MQADQLTDLKPPGHVVSPAHIYLTTQGRRGGQIGENSAISTDIDKLIAEIFP